MTKINVNSIFDKMSSFICTLNSSFFNFSWFQPGDKFWLSLTSSQCHIWIWPTLLSGCCNSARKRPFCFVVVLLKLVWKHAGQCKSGLKSKLTIYIHSGVYVRFTGSLKMLLNVLITALVWSKNEFIKKIHYYLFFQFARYAALLVGVGYGYRRYGWYRNTVRN